MHYAGDAQPHRIDGARIDQVDLHARAAFAAVFVPRRRECARAEADAGQFLGLQRGRERYKIFCTPCHGIQGDGNGMVSMRGMKHPPSYHDARLLAVPNGYIYDVITNGFGGMLSYSAQIPPADRWAIVAYVRALQLSRNAPVSELPPALREKLNTGGSPK